MEQNEMDVNTIELDSADADILYIALTIMLGRMDEGLSKGAYSGKGELDNAMLTRLSIRHLLAQLESKFDSIKTLKERVEIISAHVDENGKVIRDAINKVE